MSRSERPDAPVGFVVVDKPSGWTSHDVVAKCRGILGTRKVGHSGTLDPMATGVLVLGVGRATKLLAFLSGLPKTYDATIRFGVETDSLDADGAVTVTHDMAPPPLDRVRAAAQTLTGDLQQVPPMVSAKKVDGVRLHELARRGEVVDRAAVPVHVDRFDVGATDDPMVFTATVGCSAGTYIRVLAADLGHALGGGAHLIGLRRSAVGPFPIEEAATLEQLQADGQQFVMPPTTITRVMESVEIDVATAIDVGHGKVLDRSRLGLGADDAGPWALLGGDGGSLLAVYAAHRGDTVKPSFVMI
ncbi:MAG TPA: tRNA pseudouridine(55) synthase TruB [Microthrixaceae bacterium]|nr:tRNA pseudouridine(55) synthase TruB [Microthrixaceae bacterium]